MADAGSQVCIIFATDAVMRMLRAHEMYSFALYMHFNRIC